MDADAVSVAFDATFDELVDANMRAAERSALVRAWRRRSVITLGVAAAAGVILFGREVFRPVWLVVWAIVVGAAAAAVYRPLLWYSYARRMRQFVAEHFGGKKGVHCEIAVDRSGVHVCQGTTQTTYAWEGLTIRDDGAGDIELWSGRTVVVVRGRAFPGPEQRARFVSRIHELLRG